MPSAPFRSFLVLPDRRRHVPLAWKSVLPWNGRRPSVVIRSLPEVERDSAVLVGDQPRVEFPSVLRGESLDRDGLSGKDPPHLLIGEVFPGDRREDPVSATAGQFPRAVRLLLVAVGRARPRSAALHDIPAAAWAWPVRFRLATVSSSDVLAFHVGHGLGRNGARVSAELLVRVAGVRVPVLDVGQAWTGNGVLDRFLEDESLFGEFLRTPVSEGGVESLVVEPPHIVVEVGA